MQLNELGHVVLVFSGWSVSIDPSFGGLYMCFILQRGFESFEVSFS